MRHRPIGLGVQGLADVFIMLRMPFDSDEARSLNEDIFETIYFGAMEASMELSKVHGAYETFKGSPVSKGIFQFDMWGVTPKSGRWNWEQLKQDVKKNGVRNSLLVAPMPTASTSQILGNNECFEPYTSNIYTRRTLSGEFIVAEQTPDERPDVTRAVERNDETETDRCKRFSQCRSLKFLRTSRIFTERCGRFLRSLSSICQLTVVLTSASHRALNIHLTNAELRKAYFNALLRMEERFEDRYVLPAYECSC